MKYQALAERESVSPLVPISLWDYVNPCAPLQCSIHLATLALVLRL